MIYDSPEYSNIKHIYDAEKFLFNYIIGIMEKYNKNQ